MGCHIFAAVEVHFPLSELAFSRVQLLAGEPLLLFSFGLLEEEGLPLFSKLLPLLRQGPESFLAKTPELLRALLYIHARLRDERFQGLQLDLLGAIERQQPSQQPLLLGLVTAASRRVNDRQPGGGEHLPIQNFSFHRRPGARCPGELDEDALASLQIGAGLGLLGA